VLVGVLCGKLAGIGAWKKSAFAFRVESKQVVHSWAYKMLRDELMQAPFGIKVRIERGNKEQDPETERFMYVFKVEILGQATEEEKKNVKVPPGEKKKVVIKSRTVKAKESKPKATDSKN